MSAPSGGRARPGGGTIRRRHLWRGGVSLLWIGWGVLTPTLILLERGGLWSDKELRDDDTDTYRYTWSMFATMEPVPSEYVYLRAGSSEAVEADARDTLGRVAGRMVYADDFLERLCAHHEDAVEVRYLERVHTC